MLFVRCVIYGLCLFRDPFQLLLSSPLFSAFPSLFFPPGFDHHHMKTKKRKVERKEEREQEENDDQWKHRKQSNIWKEREREIIIMRNEWRRSSCPSGRKAYFIVKWRNEGRRMKEEENEENNEEKGGMRTRIERLLVMETGTINPRFSSLWTNFFSLRKTFGKSQVINSGVNEGKGMIKMKERELFSQKERNEKGWRWKRRLLELWEKKKWIHSRRKRTFSGYT